MLRNREGANVWVLWIRKSMRFELNQEAFVGQFSIPSNFCIISSQFLDGLSCRIETILSENWAADVLVLLFYPRYGIIHRSWLWLDLPKDLKYSFFTISYSQSTAWEDKIMHWLCSSLLRLLLRRGKKGHRCCGSWFVWPFAWWRASALAAYTTFLGRPHDPWGSVQPRFSKYWMINSIQNFQACPIAKQHLVGVNAIQQYRLVWTVLSAPKTALRIVQCIRCFIVTSWISNLNFESTIFSGVFLNLVK